jgi:ABC-type polysaccharide/polyol phosphate transport system ATPase subunit
VFAPLVPPLIHLVSLAKVYSTPEHPPKVVLRPMTLALPADRRLAVLGQRRQGKSVFLRLLAGVEAPTQGEVIAPGRMSPVARPNVLFHPRLSIAENIRFFARTLNLHPDQLTVALDAFCGTGGTLTRPTKGIDHNRTAAEMALLSMLPFDCYCVDDIGHVAEASRERLFDGAARRRAGVIFATNQTRLARRYADCAIVLRDGNVHPFSSIDEAISFDER